MKRYPALALSCAWTNMPRTGKKRKLSDLTGGAVVGRASGEA
jgi:hypothetical protein